MQSEARLRGHLLEQNPVSGAFQGSESSAYVTVSSLFDGFGGVLLDSGRRYLAYGIAPSGNC